MLEYDLLHSAGELLQAIDPFGADRAAAKARGRTESREHNKFIVLLVAELEKCQNAA